MEVNSLKRLSLADVVTLTNGLLGFLAITYIVDKRYFEASALIIACIAVDGLDGIVARWRGTEHKVGAYLDLFSDTVSFSFAPALLLYSLYYDPLLGRAWESINNAIATLVPCVIVFLAVLRLSRFADVESDLSYYRGLPTPLFALLIIVISWLFGGMYHLYFSSYFVLLGILIASSLLYSKTRYPKLRKPLYLTAGSILLVISFIGVFLSKNSYYFGTILLYTALAGCLIYMIAGPFMVAKDDRR